MLFYDIESLGVSSESVILSAAIVYVDPRENKTYEQVLDDVVFVKFDAQEQIQTYSRKVDRNTVEWWTKKEDHVRKMSFNPCKEVDVCAKEGLRILKQYAKSHKTNTTVWTRGGMDAMITESLYKQVNETPFAYFNTFRDIRTAVDILYNTSNGYTEISDLAPEFDKSKVKKHDPCHDIVYDAFMLYYGVTKE